MTIREIIEQREEAVLSPYATLSSKSRGRSRTEPHCDIRPVFQRDRDRILHSKAFRRLKDKTQVFLTPEGDHYRTRMTHTLEVSQNARTIAKALNLNEDLVEAIALGHDLGHTPFGHAGERALNEISPYGFIHSRQSLRIVEVLERGGIGLNLTWEVKDGILNHQTSGSPSTPEGRIVRISDKIAYMHHDMDDAIRAGLLKESDIPKSITDVIGDSLSKRLDSLIHDLVMTSSTLSGEIAMSPEIETAMMAMRSFLFERLYTNPVAKGEEKKASDLLKTLYDYFLHHTEKLPKDYRMMILKGEPVEIVICDYIGAMTDRFAIATYDDIFIPRSWHG